MTSNHPRNTDAMLTSPRCAASTRSGKRCRSPAVAGSRRCRMHGGKGPAVTKGKLIAVRNRLNKLTSLAQDPDALQILNRINAAIAEMDKSAG